MPKTGISGPFPASLLVEATSIDEAKQQLSKNDKKISSKINI